MLKQPPKLDDLTPWGGFAVTMIVAGLIAAAVSGTRLYLTGPVPIAEVLALGCLNGLLIGRNLNPWYSRRRLTSKLVLCGTITLVQLIVGLFLVQNSAPKNLPSTNFWPAHIDTYWSPISWLLPQVGLGEPATGFDSRTTLISSFQWLLTVLISFWIGSLQKKYSPSANPKGLLYLFRQFRTHAFFALFIAVLFLTNSEIVQSRKQAAHDYIYLEASEMIGRDIRQVLIDGDEQKLRALLSRDLDEQIIVPEKLFLTAMRPIEQEHWIIASERLTKAIIELRDNRPGKDTMLLAMLYQARSYVNEGRDRNLAAEKDIQLAIDAYINASDSNPATPLKLRFEEKMRESGYLEEFSIEVARKIEERISTVLEKEFTPATS